MPNENKAKIALDTIIRKSRVHFYKPIQIAEILFYQRINSNLDLSDIESYRNVSKKWRDEVSMRLIGRRSTSSQKYQDNLFEKNAMPPNHLVALGKLNNEGNGNVEAYIYCSLQNKLSSLLQIGESLKDSTPATFSLDDLFNFFTGTPGLKRSIDKVFEIAVYALFSTVIRALRVQVTIELGNIDEDILRDFESFIGMVVGINPKDKRLVIPANIYRLGVTNAADRGLDMWSNFGPAVQVKHINLTEDLAEDISVNITSDRIIIVCLDAEKEIIKAVLSQVGWGDRIQGIITLNNLNEWYTLCMNKKYQENLGAFLLRDLNREFQTEFPSCLEMNDFMIEREYNTKKFPVDWDVN